MAGGSRDLVSALRARLGDDRATVSAFSVNVAQCKSALLEISNGIFSVTVEGAEGPVKGVRWGLSQPLYNTVGKLIAALSKQIGYKVTSALTSSDHNTNDLIVDGIPDVSGQNSGEARHRVFADSELTDYLIEAITIHNPNYTIVSVPSAEHPYVLMKAQARAYRVLAADAVRRKGLDLSADALLKLVTDLEEQYKSDTKRQHRVIPVPKADDGKVGFGDAMQGNFIRRSLRSGYTMPYRTATPPTPPVLLQPADDDVEDTMVRLRWTQNREESFVYYELWRDTHQDVERSTGGKLASGSAAVAGGENLPVTTQYSRAGTSKQVLGVGLGVRTTPVYDGFSFFTAAELSGSSVVNVTFTDGIISPTASIGVIALGDVLEPEMEYYYRLYGINWNGEAIASEALRVRTRAIRAKFKRNVDQTLATDAITPKQGVLAGGTTVTILGTNIITGSYVEINGKRCTEVSRTSTQIVVTSPGFVNTDFIGKTQDMMMVSPTRLRDIVYRGWTYT